MRTLILVKDYHGNRSPGSFSFKNAGKDLNGISLGAAGGIAALPRFPTIQKGLNIAFRKGKSGRTAIHNDPQCLSVGFAQVAKENCFP